MNHHCYPVKASRYVQYTKNNQDVLKVAGGVAVNDIFWCLWHEVYKIWLLFGGRGGGKSETVFDRLIRNCIEDPYFNCYYGRKIYDKVRESCFETLVACIKKQGKEHLFKFSEADNSSMVVRCILNGNKFQPFGADKPENMKSIKDPTHIVCEEFDQFTFNDFQELLPTLRTQRAKCEFFAMFNTKNVLPDHWINMVFFPEQYVGQAKVHFNAMEGVPVKKIFVNFPDNYFIDHADYDAQLRLASGGNELLYRQIAAGAWGIIENDNPWIYNYKKEKHEKPVKYNIQLPVYLSFDFNNDPVACIAEQHSDFMGHRDSFHHTIHEFIGIQKIEDLCLRIKSTYPYAIFYVTGDRSGSNEDLGRNQTLYQMIQSSLGVHDRCMNVNTTNLYHADSRMLCNTMLYHYPHMYINPNTCPNLITDIQKACVDGSKPLPSALKKDRGAYKMDVFDAWRYDLQTYFNQYVKTAYLGILK